MLSYSYFFFKVNRNIVRDEQFTFDYNEFQFNASLVGSINIGDVALEQGLLIAYVGDEIRGVAN